MIPDETLQIHLEPMTSGQQETSVKQRILWVYFLIECVPRPAALGNKNTSFGLFRSGYELELGRIWTPFAWGDLARHHV